MILKIGDINWAYSEKTGAVPFILNTKNTKIMPLVGSCSVMHELLPIHRQNNPTHVGAGICALSCDYDVEMKPVDFLADVMSGKCVLSEAQRRECFGTVVITQDTPVVINSINELSSYYTASLRSSENKKAQNKRMPEDFVTSFDF